MDGIGRVRFDSVGEAAAPEGKRQRKRDSLFLSATLRFAGDSRTYEARVRNLSAGGMMVELPCAVAVGNAVTMEVRGLGEITGQIAWSTHGRLGIAFDHQVDPGRARKPVGAGGKTPGYAKPLVVSVARR